MDLNLISSCLKDILSTVAVGVALLVGGLVVTVLIVEMLNLLVYLEKKARQDW